MQSNESATQASGATTTKNANIAAELDRIDDAAKQMVAITSLFQGVFFAVVSFSDVRQSFQREWLLPFLLPVALWFLCLLLSTLAFVPRYYTYGQGGRAWRISVLLGALVGYGRDLRVAKTETQALRIIRDYKFRLLWVAYGTLVLSILLLGLDMYWYICAMPTPQPECVPICTTPTPTAAP